jgi:hypothetical protein
MPWYHRGKQLGAHGVHRASRAYPSAAPLVSVPGEHLALPLRPSCDFGTLTLPTPSHLADSAPPLYD